ncbi:DJ-1/PfpI family protein [Pseudoduganella sp. RAF53_2]|uniref:DJ-1/PfpI family protein n=1 Tax=unclassified Pseudoduganella TaxID=2637179 RepID=UPI003F9C04FD
MRIGILIFAGVHALEVGGALDVFYKAAQLAHQPAAYQFELIGLQQGPVRASNGMLFQPTCTIDAAPHDIDTLLLPGGMQLHEKAARQRLIHWLVQRAAVVRRLRSISSGTLLRALSMVEEDLGAQIASQTARELMIIPERPIRV